jgi:hypothetical protein
MFRTSLQLTIVACIYTPGVTLHASKHIKIAMCCMLAKAIMISSNRGDLLQALCNSMPTMTKCCVILNISYRQR